jgi:putative transposase
VAQSGGAIFRTAHGEDAQAGSHTSLAQLRAAILAYVDVHNERGTPFRWLKTADQILDSMRRFGLRVQQVHG